MSKRILQHPEVPENESTFSWRSTGQLEDTQEFRTWMDREFPQGAAEMENQEELETSRRTFLKLMGSSTALAGFGMVACRRPEAYIVPYTEAPEWVIPGKATYYATSMPRATGAVPLVVTTYEGRPTKLGPNRLHPDYEGTDAFAQASVLDLYSTARSRHFLKAGKKAKRAEFEAALAEIVRDPAAKIGFVFGCDESPTRSRLITEELGKKFGKAKFYQYEALTANDKDVYGDGVKLVPNFEKADKIVSLDCDFAGTDPQGSNITFFNRRKPEGATYESAPNKDVMNRLYAVESAYSLTGGMADHRLRIAPSRMIAVVAQLARQLGVSGLDRIAPLSDVNEIKWVQELAVDLEKSGEKTAVLVGSRQPAAIKHLALQINLALKNIGEGKGLQAYQTGNKNFGGIAQLTDDLNKGELETVVFLTPSNPVYDAPADLKFSEALAKAKTSIHLGERTNATAFACTWHVPAAHYLESWSDAKSVKGVYSVVQAMILPLYPDCVSEVELLLAFNSGKLLTGEGEEGAAAPAMQAVRKTFQGNEAQWREVLKKGFDSAAPTYSTVSVLATASAEQVISKATASEPSKDKLDIIFSTDASVYDGRWIDNGWLQEAPDPISKLTWDNAVLIAPKTAKELGIYDEIIALETKFASRSPDNEGEHRKSPMIKITVNGKSLTMPVLVSFGQAENTLIIPLGYGQGFNEEDELGRDTKNSHHVGLVGVNRGFDAYPLRTTETSYFATGATISLTEGRYSVALTQEHNAMYGRALAREISTDDAAHKGDFKAQLAKVKKQGNDSHAPENISLYKQEDINGQPLLSDKLHQWAMTIDLSSCMGCNACLVACQSENNIPIVGKEQVAKGREMHWIRMDRYFASQEYALDSHGNKIKTKDGYKKNPEWIRDNPALVPQPVACMQCESAPCETVCPVNATVHTEDGLNAMAYNRCIGTRYCANNCPYKARRFNFFDYNKRNPLIKNNLNKGPLGERQVGESTHLQKNPNVTVRMRGVMEKCTYCVQRIKAAVIRQKRGQKQGVLESGKLSTDASNNVSTETLRIPVDSVKTACQDACPAEAITFGNKEDGTKSVMGRAKLLERNYDLLNYIGTLPRTSYLARVKNPNPSMPDAPYIGQATIHMV